MDQTSKKHYIYYRMGSLYNILDLQIFAFPSYLPQYASIQVMSWLLFIFEDLIVESLSCYLLHQFWHNLNDALIQRL